MDSEKSSSKSKTVEFSIGGTKYEVFRSLLDRFPDTILSRMASDTWQSDPNSPLFIDRDGERFRYVLDYMRDGEVTLPGTTVSKENLMRDFTYYGFDNIPESAIKVEFAPLEAARHMVSITQEYDEEVSKLRGQKDETNLAIACSTVAHACCIRFMTTGRKNITFSILEKKERGPTSIAERTEQNGLDFEVSNTITPEIRLDRKIETLNKYLAKYGMKADSCHIGNLASGYFTYTSELCGRNLNLNQVVEIRVHLSKS